MRLVYPAFIWVLAAASAGAQLPLKFTGPPTSAEITAVDLMTRLYIFADDSMMGRAVGTVYNDKGTRYIEREVRALGLVPAGDEGYFQNLPLFTWSTDSASVMQVDGHPMVLGADYLPAAKDERKVLLDGAPVVAGGIAMDSSTWLSADEMAGRIVMMQVPATTSSFPPLNRAFRARSARATALLIVSLDNISPRTRLGILRTQAYVRDDTIPAGTPIVFITKGLASMLFGPLNAVRPRAAGRPMSGTIVLHKRHDPSRNVVAVLPGSDPLLKGQYVALGAHNDHIGFNTEPADHDSLRVANLVLRPQGEDTPPAAIVTQVQRARIRAMLDSVRLLRPARRDSIFNGADDDGSGTVSLLELAEKFAKSPVKPKRSLLFVWHSGEEEGMWGSEFFTDHPTVPRDSIVAQINVDMIGRGAAADVTGEARDGTLLHGGPGYLQIIGSRRLSTELGDLLESVNTSGAFGLTFDYAMDANGHSQNIYCRSDHYEYARFGIPIAFLTTGGHADYHQVTDEAQYIDYARMAQVAGFIHAAATTIANLDHRIVVDKPKPDPRGRCVQ